MNAVPLEPIPWSRRRWFYSVLLLFVAQIALVLCLEKRAGRSPDRPIFRTTIRLAVDEREAGRITALVEASDPTLLARPNARGFSGSAWLQPPTVDYQPILPPEPASWLAPPEGSVGTRFSSFLLTNLASPLLLMDKPLPRLPRYEPSPPPDSITAKSELRIEGDLAGRTLLTPPVLPEWAYGDMLSNTVVQTAADAEGVPLFAVLLAQSGRREADAYALRTAERARFQPLPLAATSSTRALTWGRLVFRWRTVPLPVTNAAAMLP